MITLLCDVDGVIADYLGAALDVIHGFTGHRFTPDHVTHWDFMSSPEIAQKLELFDHVTMDLVEQRMSLPGACMGLKPLPGAIAAMAEILEMAHVKTLFVTAPLGAGMTWPKEREDWLAYHLGHDRKNVIHAHRKEHVRGDIFVDDNIKHVRAWAKHNSGRAILWNAPHNRDDEWSDRMSDWQELLSILRAYGEGAVDGQRTG